MTENYNTTKKEIFKEMGNTIVNKITKENIISIAKDSFEFTKGVAYTVSAPYIIPSLYRLCKEDKPVSEKLEDSFDNSAFQSGIVTGCLVDVVQFSVYLSAAIEDGSKLWLIPLVINGISGLYETGRKMYNNAKQTVLDKHEGIEATLQTTDFK